MCFKIFAHEMRIENMKLSCILVNTCTEFLAPSAQNTPYYDVLQWHATVNYLASSGKICITLLTEKNRLLMSQ